MTHRTKIKDLKAIADDLYMVISFNRISGKRELTYGGGNIIQVMKEVMTQQKKGLDIMIVEYSEEAQQAESNIEQGFRSERGTYAQYFEALKPFMIAHKGGL